MNIKIGLVAFVPVLSGCGLALGAGVHGAYEDVYYEDQAHSAYGGVYFDADYGRHVNYARLPVPRGHLPSAGRCKVWLPGVAPGHQARSGSCRSLQRRVPAGAWLLIRPRQYPGSVELIHFDSRRRGVQVRYVYDVRSKRRMHPY